MSTVMEKRVEVSGRGPMVGAIVLVAFIVAFAARFGWDLAGRALALLG
jgi:hypothetical protein